MNLLNLLFIMFFASATSAENQVDLQSVKLIDKCPVCHAIQTKTGQTKAEYGKILEEYKCSGEHVFWKPMFSSSPTETEKAKTNTGIGEDCNCPICSFSGYITGNLNVKRCINGHEFECK